MNTERIKSSTQIIFRFTSFQQAHKTRSAHVFNSELTFTPPNCSHVHYRNKYFINCRSYNDVPWGNHNKPFRNNAHGKFIHIITGRLKEDLTVAASVAGDERERAFAGPCMHEPETQQYEVKTRYNYFSSIQNDLKFRTKSS